MLRDWNVAAYDISTAMYFSYYSFLFPLTLLLKIYLFKKSLYKKQFPDDNTFSDKYSHKITWVNQNNKGFKIIVDVERDKDDILDNVTKLRIIKNKRLYSVSDGFLKTWSDPTLTINFLGWNKGQWKSSHINMIRKIEKKITGNPFLFFLGWMVVMGWPALISDVSNSPWFIVYGFVGVIGLIFAASWWWSYVHKGE